MLQLKLETCNTTPIKSIGSLIDIGSPTDIGSSTGIKRPIDVNNIFKNKEADHLPYEDSEEADHLFQIVRIQYITKKEAREVVSGENP